MNNKALYYVWMAVAAVVFIAAALMTIAIPLSIGFVMNNFNGPLTYAFIVFGLWALGFVSFYVSRRYRGVVLDQGDVGTPQRSMIARRVAGAVLIVLVGVLVIAIIDALGG